ncbi:MAG: hypothetical protein ACRD5Z_15470, partial [Bryobacteraceae bacterium]
GQAIRRQFIVGDAQGVACGSANPLGPTSPPATDLRHTSHSYHVPANHESTMLRGSVNEASSPGD